MAVRPSRTSSPVRLLSFSLSRFFARANSLIDLVSALRNPSSWVPPSWVLMLLATESTESVQSAFKLMRTIVTIGWAIYPLGYFLGYLTGGEPSSSADTLNIVYNIADVVNKIAFGAIIWSIATAKHED